MCRRGRWPAHETRERNVNFVRQCEGACNNMSQTEIAHAYPSFKKKKKRFSSTTDAGF
jgi:hypothetical protein